MTEDASDETGDATLKFEFTATILHWRGPSPFFFAPIPPEQAKHLATLARSVSYGWGVVPVEAMIGGVVFSTSLFPRDQTYLLPIKAEVRRKTGVTAGDEVAVRMILGRSGRSR